MTEKNSVSDPARIRALAHPIRLELLDIITESREATATECAERIGESVASCSFHLRMLAKYGFIEPAPRRGREKPWRPVSHSLDVRPSPDAPGSVPAVAELAALSLERATSYTRAFLQNLDREPAEWIDAMTVTRSTFWATAEEMAELSKEMWALTERFAGRQDDPSLRPEGARPSRLFATVHPDLPSHGEESDS